MRVKQSETAAVRRRNRPCHTSHRLLGILVWSLQLAFCPDAPAQSIAPATPVLSESEIKDASGPSHHDVRANTPLSNSRVPSGSSSAVPKQGDNPPVISERRSLDDAVRGVVTNQVITLVGQDFYNAFVTTWRDAPLTERYNISIYERPSARWGSLVWVEFEHRRLFEAFLPPTRTSIRSIAERAANLAYQNLVQTDLERLLFKDQDLARDEM